MKCKACGALIQDEFKFCPECGAPVDSSCVDDQPEKSFQPESVKPAPLETVLERYSQASDPLDSDRPDTTARMPKIETENVVDPVVKYVDSRRGRTSLRTPLKYLCWILVVCALVFGLYYVVQNASFSSNGDSGSGVLTTQSSSREQTATQVKSDFASYSWTELKVIADEIASCGSEVRAHALARTYHLENADGSPIDGTHDLILSDGTSIDCRIVDFYRDDRADGSGKAGITFMTVGGVPSAQANTYNTIQGGWKDSGLRAYLSDVMLPLLPQEVSGAILPVNKMTNNYGLTSYTDSVTSTVDSLWAFSFIELAGPVSSTVSWYEAGNTSIYSVYRAEGSQYNLFSKAGIDPDFGDNPLLSVTDSSGAAASWWMRTPSPLFSGRFLCVSASGDVTVADDASSENAAVFGFCL